MSTELQEPEGIVAAQAALDEFRASHDECNEFFGGVFDELQSLSLELFARHKCQEQNNGRKSTADASLAACREEVRYAVEQIQQVAEKVESQIALLASVVSEMAQTRDNSSSEAQMAAVLEAMRWQQADWLQQRAGLEAEVETLRSRAAERPEGSYTVKLLDDPKLIGEKVEEEAEEVVRAAREETDERVAEEAADLLYHLSVLLASREVPQSAAMEVLDGRRR